MRSREKRKNIQSEEFRNDKFNDRKVQNTFVKYCLFFLNHPEYTHESRILGRWITRVKFKKRMKLNGHLELGTEGFESQEK